MFLLIGAGPHTKQIGDSQMMICPSCGRFSRMTPYVRRQEIRLFFLPVARFRRQYYAKASCCGEIFQLDPEVGPLGLVRGRSVTDACMGWDATEEALRELADGARRRRG